MNKIGVTQKAIVFNKEGSFLVIKRTKTAPSSPGKWDLPGGDLEFGEDPKKGMAREIKEETGLIVEKLEPFETWAGVIKALGDFWVTIAYTAKAKTEKVKLSWEHNDFKWVDKREFSKLEAAEKIKYFVKKVKLTKAK